jgi:hypothetical protein
MANAAGAKIREMKNRPKLFLIGTLLFLSLCCIGGLIFRNAAITSHSIVQDLYCHQIQPGMNREEVFSIIKKTGEFDASKREDRESATYVISFNRFPLSILSNQAVIYFENDIYTGKVTYGSFNDLLPICND